MCVDKFLSFCVKDLEGDRNDFFDIYSLCITL